MDFQGHGPNWLVGRTGITRKTKKAAMKIENANSSELAKIRDELASEMEDKMNKKLEKILGKLAEENPSLNINVKELLVDACAEDEPATVGVEEVV